MFADQHLDSLGGAQVSMTLQRRFLERAGHTVTVVAPRMHGAGDDSDPGFIDTPSLPITPDRQYSFSWPGPRTERFVERALAARPPIDLVHVQADFWGAVLGHRYARDHGVPVVHTMHNRVDVGLAAVAPFPGAVLRVLNAWQRRMLPPPAGWPRASDGWAYLRGLAAGSAAVTAPSAHFARRLEEHDVFAPVDVVWNGIDDDVLDTVLAEQHERTPGPPRFLWLGRMSPEKRLLPFLEAFALSGAHARVDVIGGGAQLGPARRLVRRLGVAGSVDFVGRVSYREVLKRMADADAVVQTSIGFETQGMTVFEAAALGTPSVVSDPDIAGELGRGHWCVTGPSVSALADTLRRAAGDIERGEAPVPDPEVGAQFRQSSRTAAMLQVYERVLAQGSRRQSVRMRE